MNHQATQVIREFVAAVQAGNHEKLGALLHPAIEWHQPGSHRFAGIKKSSAEVFQMVGGMYEVSQGTFALTENKFIGMNGNQVACLLHFQAARGSTLLDVDNVDVYTVEEGQIVAAKIYSADLEQEDHFWGN